MSRLAAAQRTDWPEVPIWSIARRVSETGYQNLRLLSVYRDWGVVAREGRTDNHNRASEDLSMYQRVLPGDLVLNKMKTWQGSLGVSSLEGIVSPAYIVCRTAQESVHGPYLHHLLRSAPAIAKYGALSKGIRPQQWDLPWEQFRTVQVALPPMDEQRRIADFLDDQVSRLDHVIELRQTQPALLKERYRSRLQGALIDDQDTNPRRPLAVLCDPARPIQYGIVLPGPNFPGGVPIIKGGDVGARRMDADLLQRTQPEIDAQYARSRVAGGDIVISIRGSYGEVCQVPVALSGANLTQDSARIAPSGVDGDWLQAVLETPDLQTQMAMRATGAMVKGLNIFELRRLQVPTPDHSTQVALARVALQERERLDRLTGLLDRSLALLQERKQSLITASVTGRFDVTTARSVA
jgi:type I restriction enzyme S subunit